MDKIISSFIDFIIESKKLIFDAKGSNFDKYLFKNNIIKIEDKTIKISDYSLISSEFIEKYKEKFNFKISQDFSKNISFINNINKDFTKKEYIENYHFFEKEIWKHIIKESNSKYKCSFNEYLNSIDLENKPDELYSFVEAYSNLLYNLEITDNIIFENTLILAQITKSDADFNVDFGNVLNGIKNKCKVDYNSGLKLLDKSLILEEENERIISAVITGLYENKKNEFYDSVLKGLLRKKIKLNSIFFGLANVKEIEINECEIYLNLANSHKNNHSLIISVLSLIFSILKSKHTEYHNFCFKELKEAIKIEKSAYYILTNLVHANNYNKQNTEIIVKLVNQNYFTIEKHIHLIRNVFWHLEEFDSFKKIVLNIIEKKPFEKFIKIFNSYLNSADKILLDKFIIKLLTNNKACKRFTGIEIFNQLSDNIPYKFTFNILGLSNISQYKLWMTLTQDFHDPKNRLISLLPLIDSKSGLIKESFLCKLEELSEDYGGHITKILEDNLDKKIYFLVIDRIKKYIDEYYEENIDIKKTILELNPYHTHYKSINHFNFLFSKNMHQTINKGAEENSFLSIMGANTINLAKGGGWRSGKDKKISQLGKFGSNIIMPRSYFINPNKYDLELDYIIHKDWNDKDFLVIKNLLKDEQ